MRRRTTAHAAAENHNVLLIDSNNLIGIVISINSVIKYVFLISFKDIVVIWCIRVKLLSILSTFNIAIIRWPTSKSHINL